MRRLMLWAYAFCYWLSRSKRPALAAFGHGKAGTLWARLWPTQEEQAGRFVWRPRTDRQAWLVSQAREAGAVERERIGP
jgi:hypothetical protein